VIIKRKTHKKSWRNCEWNTSSGAWFFSRSNRCILFFIVFQHENQTLWRPLDILSFLYIDFGAYHIHDIPHIHHRRVINSDFDSFCKWPFLFRLPFETMIEKHETSSKSEKLVSFSASKERQWSSLSIVCESLIQEYHFKNPPSQTTLRCILSSDIYVRR
jgi:hypothetical protein